MDGLLFLVHRIPYPPNKGDKIRSFHFLKHLSQIYRVHLGAFVDDPADWSVADEVRRYCVDACLVPLSPFRARVRSLRGFATGAPLSVPYFGSRRLGDWVGRVLRQPDVQRVLAFSSPMAQYVIGKTTRTGVRSVLDFVDVDSDKWHQYAEKKSWPVSSVYAREARALLRYERGAAAAFDASVFVSRAEADLFRQLAPEEAEKVTHVENGVDTDYFSPDRDYPDPYDRGGPVLVFTGAMDYWANVDAVRWFATEVMPLLRERVSDVRFFIVGSRPTEEVVRLGREPGVVVTGAVDDVRPYLAHAQGAVAPLRIARGIQNKVLEAMAMATPVIASPQALDGLELESEYPLIAGEPSDWVDLTRNILRSTSGEDTTRTLLRWIHRRYDWHEAISALRRVLDGDHLEAAGSAASARPTGASGE
jgi:sugar transferase (PEP-CTERM/EpsH1 system associated)